jgi:hypothetical protein
MRLTNTRSPAAVRRRAVLCASCAVALLGSLAAAGPALAGGVLYVTTSTYAGTKNTVTVGQPLPNSAGVTAIADGSYPGVWANDTVDPNFGITAPIVLHAYTLKTAGAGGLQVGSLLREVNVTAASGISTSFSSKSELAVNPSTDGTSLTLMGYDATPNAIDISNTNTPDNIDSTNTDTQTPTYRAVVQIGLNTKGVPVSVAATPVDSYSGNNGRGAILANNANGSGTDEYLLVGNAGNGSGTEPTDIVNDTGVQSILPGANSPISTVIGAQQGTPGSKNGFEYGFSVALIGDPADKSGKDDNFRGITVFNNTLYVTKGSGSNGVDTVYQVNPGTGGLPVAATGPATQISILPGLPTGLASAISEGNPSTEFFPFGVWFANATTMYVADEGSGDLNPDPNAGLQKWIFNGTQWNLAYTIQAGLNLDLPYSVPNYPSQYNPATTGLRNLTGAVQGNSVTLFAATSTYSTLGDPGADPNAVVSVVDQLDATTLPPSEAFSVIGKPTYRNVYRGVAVLATE